MRIDLAQLLCFVNAGSGMCELTNQRRPRILGEGHESTEATTDVLAAALHRMRKLMCLF